MVAMLSVYANCSLGGVASVMRERLRIAGAAGLETDFYFFQDFGGGQALIKAGAASVRIGRASHEGNVLTLAKTRGYGAASLFSHYTLGQELRAGGTPVFAEVHGSHDSALKDLRVAEGGYDRIVVPSAWSKGWLAANGFKERLIDVVPNAIDRSVFHPGPAGDVSPAEGPRPVVWVGRLEEHKNWRDALHIFAILRRRSLPVRPIMALSLHNDRERVEAFFRQVSLLGLMDALTVLYNVPQRELGELLRRAAAEGGCLLATSKLESFGLAVSESLACRLPVVSSAVGAVPERVVSGRDGFLFDYGERERPVDQIETLLFDETERARIDAAVAAADNTGSAEAEAAYRRMLESVGALAPTGA